MADFLLRPYQKEAIDSNMELLDKYSSLINILPTSCLSGDTKIRVSRGKKGYEDTIKNLFNKTNNNPEKVKFIRQLNTKIPTYVRSFDGEFIKLNKALQFFYSGKKEVLKVVLENGLSIKATACHRFLTSKGFIRLDELTLKHKVMCDTLKPIKSVSKTNRVNYYVSNLWHHPFASVTKTNKEKRGFTKRIAIHRAIYECHLNSISLDEYKQILKTQPKHSLKLIPKDFDIHHKDHNYLNNDINNLQLVTKKQHRKLHNTYENFLQGVPTYSKVVSIEEVGFEDTYDIECVSPHHNFVANGMVVHNSGKTEIFAEIASKFIQKTNKKVLILSHLTTLVDQTKQRLELRTSLKIGVMQAQNYPNIGDMCIIGTRQTVSNVSNIAPFKNQIGLIIVDEVHGFLTKQYDTIRKTLPDAKLIGFTATPYRDAKLITNHFDKIAYSISLQEMMDKGYVVKPILRQITLADDAEIGERIAKVIKIHKERENGKSAAIFLNRKENCKLARNAFVNAGIACAVVVDNTNKKIREQRLKDFQEGKFEILITCNVVSEGFDAPRLEVIYMPHNTSSPTAYIQRMGRAMRLYPDKQSCRIYAFGDSPQIKKGYYYALNMGEKKKITAREELEIMELTGEVTGESYMWTKQIVEIANKLKGLGKLNLAESLLNKEFPKKYMQNPDLIIQYQDKITSDDIAKFEQEFLNAYGKENEYHVIDGLMKGKHVKDLPWMYKKRAWSRINGVWEFPDNPYKQIRKYYRLKRGGFL